MNDNTHPMDRLLPMLRGERNIDIPESDWEEVGEAGLLTAAITICGLRMHVTAIPVVMVSDGDDSGGQTQHALSPEHATQLDQLTEAFGPDRSWDTLTMRGRSYVLFADPFC